MKTQTLLVFFLVLCLSLEASAEVQDFTFTNMFMHVGRVYDKYGHKPMGPRVSKDIFTEMFIDFGAWLTNPNMGTFFRWYGNISMFYLIPFVGGYFRPEAMRQYNSDRVTYDNAEITETQLFANSIGIFKEKYWQVFGKVPRY